MFFVLNLLIILTFSSCTSQTIRVNHPDGRPSDDDLLYITTNFCTHYNCVILVGEIEHLIATGHYRGGVTHDLTNHVTWSAISPETSSVNSRDIALKFVAELDVPASINSRGIALGLAPGQVNFVASYAGMTSDTPSGNVQNPTAKFAYFVSSRSAFSSGEGNVNALQRCDINTSTTDPTKVRTFTNCTDITEQVVIDGNKLLLQSEIGLRSVVIDNKSTPHRIYIGYIGPPPPDPYGDFNLQQQGGIIGCNLNKTGDILLPCTSYIIPYVNSFKVKGFGGAYSLALTSQDSSPLGKTLSVGINTLGDQFNTTVDLMWQSPIEGMSSTSFKKKASTYSKKFTENTIVALSSEGSKIYFTTEHKNAMNNKSLNTYIWDPTSLSVNSTEISFLKATEESTQIYPAHLAFPPSQTNNWAFASANKNMDSGNTQSNSGIYACTAPIIITPRVNCTLELSGPNTPLNQPFPWDETYYTVQNPSFLTITGDALYYLDPNNTRAFICTFLTKKGPTAYDSLDQCFDQSQSQAGTTSIKFQGNNVPYAMAIYFVE